MESKLKALPPQPGRQIQVIGAGMYGDLFLKRAIHKGGYRIISANTIPGLPRTGTNSFCAALAILLDGPAYHVGVQTVLAGPDETVIQNWIALMNLWPPSTEDQKQNFMDRLHSELSGFIAVADPPASLLVPELMELYPDAKVIVTTRAKTKWAASMLAVKKLIIPFWISKTLYLFIPTLRHMPTFWGQLPAIFTARHGETMTDEASVSRIYDAHHAWLREVVPAKKLFFVDVKEGWGPLCEALGVRMPVGLEFPRLNDGRDMEVLFKGFAMQGLMRWGVVLAAVGVVGLAWWWVR